VKRPSTNISPIFPFKILHSPHKDYFYPKIESGKKTINHKMLGRILHHRRNPIAIDHQEDSDDSWNKEDDPCTVENKPRRWVYQSHNGPWFSSLEKNMSKEEILQLYSNVAPVYRTAVFWRNFSELCLSKGWKEFLSSDGTRINIKELKASLEDYSSSEKHPPVTERSADSSLYKTCYISKEQEETGAETEEPITHWRMEPPTVFIGRGNHPLRGCLRKRISPEDVTLNLSEDAPVPDLPRGRKWRDVVHRPECAWLWSWEDSLLGKTKYVYPASISATHAEIEKIKFDEASELGRYITKIRKFYTESLQKGEFLELACVLYLIDNLGIRIGNDNNLKVDGATTLRVENVQPLDERRTVWIRFVGKDSVEYNNKIVCIREFVEAIRTLSRNKSPADFLFPNVNARIVNSYLQSYHPSLKAKTFRTFNATQRFANAIKEYSPNDADPVSWFKKCVMEVAVFCNHKRISTLRKRQEQYSPVTSITNYIDPRVVVEWARSVGVPLNKIYTRTLLERFSWALE
jgi:DNA topoisomerase IB